MNKKLEKAAKGQIKEDRELLREIGEGLSPEKNKPILDVEEDKGNKLKSLSKRSKSRERYKISNNPNNLFAEYAEAKLYTHKMCDDLPLIFSSIIKKV